MSTGTSTTTAIPTATTTSTTTTTTLPPPVKEEISFINIEITNALITTIPLFDDVDFTDIPEGEDVAAAYENGYVGSAYSGEAEEQLQSAVEEDGGKFEMQDNSSAGGFSGQGKGKIILIHKEIEKVGWLDKVGYPNWYLISWEGMYGIKLSKKPFFFLFSKLCFR